MPIKSQCALLLAPRELVFEERQLSYTQRDGILSLPKLL